MALKRHKIYLWLAIIKVLYSLSYTKASCELTELSKYDNVCVGSLQCDQMIDFEPTSWTCITIIKEVYEDNYYRGYGNRRSHQEITYATNYELHVTVTNIDIEHDILENADEFMDNIKTIHILDGSLFSVPQNFYQLSQITEIEIINTGLATVDLNRYVPLSNLEILNFKNNSIDYLYEDKQKYVLGSRSIHTIDLSQNILKSIPHTSFSLFTELQHLNLSHNQIRSFSILTFEGVRELITLDISYNMLYEIGNSFTRFVNLEKLYLQNNELTKLEEYNLNALIKLKQLNLSSNMIDTFENNSFVNNVLLEYLDISKNKIKNVPKQLFQKNNLLDSIIFSNNNINHIDDDAFAVNNITEFDIRNNCLTGSIEKKTFKGVHVAVLDLSVGNITALGDEAFKYMCQDLNTLNVSSNMISSISKSAFSCLEQLTVLDLSNNRLEELTFETNSLNLLSEVYVRNNSIKNITKNAFKGLISLKTVDLSYNEIKEIESQSFVDLYNVETLTISHNPFISSLENNTLNGLISLKSIDISFARTTSFKNGSFSGLLALMHINSSFGQLTDISYNAFIQTGSIERLDLSHNLLNIFHINSTSISKVEEIYLNNNLIVHIMNDTFSGFSRLRMLNLVDNNIQRMETYALKNLDRLSHLYLSSNVQMEIVGSPFDNLINLYQVKLDGIKTKFLFQNKISIELLDLHSCEISDLNELTIFKVNFLRELNLSDNKISKIDKFSFQSMPFLIELDLSLNRISFIQPGSFLQVSDLKILSLFGNNLQMLQFGVFDGIKALRLVNLSSNALQSFDPKLLPVALSIALDNNVISSLSFEDIFKSKIEKLSVGGNSISCKVLADLKTSNFSEKYTKIVTTATLDFHSENVDGISCQSAPKESGIILPETNNTGYDITPIFIKFTNAVENLRSSIETLGNKTPENSYEMKSDITKLVNSIHALVNISNQTHINSEDYYKKMENITNATQIHLDDIKEQLINLTNKNPNSSLGNDASYIKSNDNNDIRTEMKKMLKEEMDAIREEFGKAYQNFQKRDPLPLAQVVEKESTDDKILYFIATALGIIIVLYVINIVYSYLRSKRGLNSLHYRRPIASEMEME